MNNHGKINLSSFIIVLSLIIIIITCIFIFKTYKENTSYKNQITNNIVSNIENNNEINNNSIEENSDNNISNNIDTTNNIFDKEELFVYSSADNSAARGYPELLYVYDINDNKIVFKYHAPWFEEDVKGEAIKAEENTYIYEKDNYKIEILLSDEGENSVKVTEYKDNELVSWKNLWK